MLASARTRPLLSVWHAYHDADSVLVDIPIGLLARGRRFRADNRDDLLDAMCLALAGWTDRGTLDTLSADPERDVLMEIVYRGV